MGGKKGKEKGAKERTQAKRNLVSKNPSAVKRIYLAKGSIDSERKKETREVTEIQEF